MKTESQRCDLGQISDRGEIMQPCVSYAFFNLTDINVMDHAKVTGLVPIEQHHCDI